MSNTTKQNLRWSQTLQTLQTLLVNHAKHQSIYQQLPNNTYRFTAQSIAPKIWLVIVPSLPLWFDGYASLFPVSIAASWQSSAGLSACGGDPSLAS